MVVVLWLCVVLAVGAYLCGPIVDPDLWWHITVGRWITSHGQIPSVDLWNRFGHGQPWRAYSWFSEIVLALTDNTWGIRGLLVLQVVLAITIVGVWAYTFAKLSGDYFIGLLLGVIASVACFQHYTLRPQSVVWVLAALLILNLERIARGEVSKSVFLVIGLIGCAWANTHITTVLGLLIIVGWLAGSVPSRTIASSLTSYLLGTLCTPYVGGEWLTFLNKTGHPMSMRSIAEFQPATIMQYSTGFLLLMGVLLVMQMARAPKSVPAMRVLLCVGFVLGGLAVTKFMPFALLVVGATLAQVWREFRIDSGITEGLLRLKAALCWLPREGAAFVCLCLFAIFVNKLWQAPLSDRIVPVQAVDFMQQNKLPTPIMNDFGRGGYLMYRYSDRQGELAPEYLVAIDGRTNVNPHEVWLKAHAALHGQPSWHEWIELVKPSTILWPTESPMVTLLKETGEFCEVFHSGSLKEGFSVLVKPEVVKQLHLPVVSGHCQP